VVQAAYLLLAALLEAALDDFARQEQQTLHCAQTNANIGYNYGGLQSRRNGAEVRPVPVQTWQG
jgi:hypothetical protein